MKPKKLLSFILAAVMAISLLPTFTLTASATTSTTTKNITLGGSALHNADTTNSKWDYVYFGIYNNNSIKWRILSTDGNTTEATNAANSSTDTATYKTAGGSTYTGNALFMLSENTLFKTQFDATDNAWLTSNLRDKMQNDIFGDDSDELKYVLKTTKTDSSETIGYLNPYNNMAQYTIDWGGSSLSDDTLFALSAREVEQYLGSGEKYANRASGDAAWWWLRSPYAVFTRGVGVVRDGGVVDISGVDGDLGVRPAFNLNLSSVLFTSAVGGGKSSTAAAGGGAEISKNADYAIGGDEKYEYKLTMLDTSREFEVEEETAKGTKGETITFNYNYKNAETGLNSNSNEYISAMIVNDNDEVLYYGQLANITNSTDESGTVDFKIPSDIEYGTYKLKLFNEQINGDYKTDFSSAFETLTLSVKEKPIDNSIALTAPVKKGEPQTELETDEYTATVAWSPDAEDKFAARTAYTATITITPKKNYTTDGITEFKVDGAESVELKSNDGTTAIIEAVFPKTKGGASYAAGTVVGGGGVAGGNAPKNDNKKDDIVEPNDTAVPDDKNDDEKGENAADQNPVNGEWENPFTDVKENDWFFNNVKYANENGLMSGVTNTTFAANDSLTRAMLVTVLWRAEGEPNVDFAMPFTDVADTAYYAEAVRWAASENIVKGISETEFAPDMNITREQIAAILYRYAKFKGYDVTQGGMQIREYEDFESISDYAINAMTWAVNTGLMKGKTETTLNPKDFATRAEIAAILQRFIEENK